MSNEPASSGPNRIPEGTALQADSLLAYQSGAIVSRTLIKTPTSTITIFAFDAGQALSEHTAPFDALVHLLDGEAEVSIDGRPVLLRAGQLVLMPANIPHAVTAKTPMKMLLTMLRS
ncbi:MAG: cupin domain-containing protein [Deltaproteobacteria bacterium]|nr:cupin domain-containing protein [Deltaproteobacteria bacterium]